MDLEARSLGQPGAHFGMFVGGVIIRDQMHIQMWRNGAIDPLQKTKELLVSVPGLAVGEHGSSSDVEGCKQGGGAMADIVMRDTLHVAQSHGQHGLCATEGLDLRLLIHRQHDSVVWRVQIQGDDIAYLLHKKRVVGQLECLRAIGQRSETPGERSISTDGWLPLLVERSSVFRQVV